MRTVILAIGLLAVAAQAAADSCDQGDVVYSDDFSELHDDWGSAQPGIAVESGQLRVTMPASRALNLVSSAKFASPTQICMTVTTVESASPYQTWVGLIFWHVDASNYFLFEIAPNGTATFFRIEGGHGSPIARWQPFSGVSAGNGATNELRVEADGSKVAVFVNDQRFAETEAVPPARNQSIGFSFSAPPEGPATYAVDALRAVSN